MRKWLVRHQSPGHYSLLSDFPDTHADATKRAEAIADEAKGLRGHCVTVIHTYTLTRGMDDETLAYGVLHGESERIGYKQIDVAGWDAAKIVRIHQQRSLR